MSDGVAYSPSKDDLYFPCKNAQFFSAGKPTTDSGLCVELSRLAYCRSGDTNFRMDRARVSRELDRVDFELGDILESQGTPNGTGTHCFLALRKDKKLAVVSFRGTDGDDPTDVAHDANGVPVPWVGGGKVHAGFMAALTDVKSDLQNALAAIRCPLLFTGHSLGAALATLFASIRTPGALYTFGSPLVGDSQFLVTLQDTKNYRYVDCCDVVTRVPPQSLGYRHLGQPYYIAKDRSILFDPEEAFIRSDRLKAFLEYPIEYSAWRRENVGVRELADHAPVNYVTAVTAAGAPQ